MAEAVHKASIICCFMTAEYENSPNDNRELEYAQKLGKTIIPCMLSDKEVWKPTPGKWLALITSSIIAIDFSDTSDANIRVQTNELINRIKERSSAPSVSSTDLFERIRSKYLKESQIKRIVNEETSFPIEQSYINLATVGNNGQKYQEYRLEQETHGTTKAVRSTFAEICRINTSIDIANIFEKCKDRIKKVLIFGRAGIGKSTFCQYVTYQWARGEIWPEYDLVVLIHLRKLTHSSYPPGKEYSLVDLMQQEYSSFEELTNEDKKYFKEQCNKEKVLWILDDYDEFAQIIPEHLKDVVDHVRNTQHHVLTSRQHAISLSYDIRMEIVGFTDDNIVKYVGQFFDQISNGMANSSLDREKLFRFLRSNSRIWGIAHIPVILELICSLWNNTDASETAMLTMTRLYDSITEWLCRRYLARQGKKHETMTKQSVYKLCQTELQFLEHLAFKAMENNEILLSPAVLEETGKEIGKIFADHPQLLNIGILKSYDRQPTDDRAETSKQHYFVHLTFQQYFAARHLLCTLQCSNKKKALDFINGNKYNQRFLLVFIFSSGLLAQPEYKSAMHVFWAAIQEEPLDLVGIKHIKLIIECINEIISQTVSRDNSFYLKKISQWLGICARQKSSALTGHISQSLQRATYVVNTSLIQEKFRALLETDDQLTKLNVLRLLSGVPKTEVTPKLLLTISATLSDENEDDSVRQEACTILREISKKIVPRETIAPLLGAMDDKDAYVRQTAGEALSVIDGKEATGELIGVLVSAIGDGPDLNRSAACKALGKIGGKAATSEVISALVGALGDEQYTVRRDARKALEKIGEKAATSNVIGALVDAMDDEHDRLRISACEVLGEMGERAATSEAVAALVRATGDEQYQVRSAACEALGLIGEIAATSEVVAALMGAMRDKIEDVRRCACKAVGKMGEKAATSEVIDALVRVMRDEVEDLRISIWEALGKMGEKAATSEVIDVLIRGMRDEDEDVQRCARKALEKIAKRAATSGVIDALVGAMGDEYSLVRADACKILGKIGDKAATSEVIAALVDAIDDRADFVRRSACKAVGRMGRKTATNEVIAALVTAMGDEHDMVRQDACQALKEIGEKVVTNEVIDALLGALRHGVKYVRMSACEVLRKMGQKGATREVIAALGRSMGDEYERVRISSCEAVGAIGEKAATSEVITALVGAMGDGVRDVRQRACDAVRRIGERAATCEMIDALVVAVGDETEYVRISACQAVGAMGEKAATSEVIAALVVAMRDEASYVRICACQAVREMGEKAATCEVIAALVDASVGNANFWDCETIPILERAMCASDGMEKLRPEMIAKLVSCCMELRLEQWDWFPSDLLIKLYSESGDDSWLPLVVFVARIQGVAVTGVDDTIKVYNSNGVDELQVSDGVLLERLTEAFRRQKRQLESDSEAGDVNWK